MAWKTPLRVKALAPCKTRNIYNYRSSAHTKMLTAVVSDAHAFGLRLNEELISAPILSKMMCGQKDAAREAMHVR